MIKHLKFVKEQNPERTIQKGQLLRLKLKSSLSLIVLLVLTNMGFTQNNNATTQNFDVNLEIKNMHTWHGSVVTPGIMMASSIEFNSNDKKFVAGLWGGASADGTYKEFSYYTTYSFTNNFNVSLISHNNYSNAENYDIFSYDKYTSPNFVDIVFEYTVSDDIPLTAYWSTILFGNGGDFEYNADSTVNDSYSNYMELRYTFFKEKKTNLTLFAGGAFSFTTEKTFYSNSPNLIQAGLSVQRYVTLFSKELPITGTAFWNPETKLGVLQLAISLF